MSLGNRSLRRTLTAPFHAANWRALVGMTRTYPPRYLPGIMWRYLSGHGRYPMIARVRTPLGTVRPSLYSYDDLLTLNEVFARRDYAVPYDPYVVVDIGANIGFTALYFLTRNPHTHVYCVEPNPANVVRLRGTLAQFRDRYTLIEAAATIGGTTVVTLWVEPSGRYGSTARRDQTDYVTVPARSLRSILDEVIVNWDRIDLLKIDTEGTEEVLISSISTAHRAHVARILYENKDGKIVGL